MKKANQGPVTLLTNDILAYDNYEDYLTLCDDFDREPQGEDSEDYYNYMQHEMEANWEDDLYELSHMEKMPVVVMGTLGLWWGKPEIQPLMFNSLHDAIIDVSSESAATMDAEWEGGVVTVKVAHHDGTNVFTIRALSKKGQDKFRIAKERWEDVLLQDLKEWDFKRIPYPYA